MESSSLLSIHEEFLQSLHVPNIVINDNIVQPSQKIKGNMSLGYDMKSLRKQLELLREDITKRSQNISLICEKNKDLQEYMYAVSSCLDENEKLCISRLSFLQQNFEKIKEDIVILRELKATTKKRDEDNEKLITINTNVKLLRDSNFNIRQDIQQNEKIIENLRFEIQNEVKTLQKNHERIKIAQLTVEKNLINPNSLILADNYYYNNIFTKKKYFKIFINNLIKNKLFSQFLKKLKIIYNKNNLYYYFNIWNKIIFIKKLKIKNILKQFFEIWKLKILQKRIIFIYSRKRILKLRWNLWKLFIINYKKLKLFQLKYYNLNKKNKLKLIFLKWKNLKSKPKKIYFQEPQKISIKLFFNYWKKYSEISYNNLLLKQEKLIFIFYKKLKFYLNNWKNLTFAQLFHRNFISRYYLNKLKLLIINNYNINNKLIINNNNLKLKFKKYGFKKWILFIKLRPLNKTLEINKFLIKKYFKKLIIKKSINNNITYNIVIKYLFKKFKSLINFRIHNILKYNYNNIKLKLKFHYWKNNYKLNKKYKLIIKKNNNKLINLYFNYWIFLTQKKISKNIKLINFNYSKNEIKKLFLLEKLNNLKYENNRILNDKNIINENIKNLISEKNIKLNNLKLQNLNIINLKDELINNQNKLINLKNIINNLNKNLILIKPLELKIINFYKNLELQKNEILNNLKIQENLIINLNIKNNELNLKFNKLKDNLIILENRNTENLQLIFKISENLQNLKINNNLINNFNNNNLIEELNLINQKIELIKINGIKNLDIKNNEIRKKTAILQVRHRELENQEMKIQTLEELINEKIKNYENEKINLKLNQDSNELNELWEVLKRVRGDK